MIGAGAVLAFVSARAFENGNTPKRVTGRVFRSETSLETISNGKIEDCESARKAGCRFFAGPA